MESPCFSGILVTSAFAESYSKVNIIILIDIDRIFTWTITMASVKPLHCNMCNGYLKDNFRLHLILRRHMTTLTRGEEVLPQEEGILLFQPSSLSSANPTLSSYQQFIIIFIRHTGIIFYNQNSRQAFESELNIDMLPLHRFDLFAF